MSMDPMQEARQIEERAALEMMKGEEKKPTPLPFLEPAAPVSLAALDDRAFRREAALRILCAQAAHGDEIDSLSIDAAIHVAGELARKVGSP